MPKCLPSCTLMLACQLLEDPGLTVSLCCLRISQGSHCFQDIWSVKQSSPLPCSPSNSLIPTSCTAATHSSPKPQRPAPSALWPPSQWGSVQTVPIPVSVCLTSYWSFSSPFKHCLPQKAFLKLFPLCFPLCSQRTWSKHLISLFFHLNYTSHYRKYAKASGYSSMFSTGAMQTALRSRNKTQVLRNPTLPSLQPLWKTVWEYLPKPNQIFSKVADCPGPFILSWQWYLPCLFSLIKSWSEGL